MSIVQGCWVHVLLVPFPTGDLDPHPIHGSIWVCPRWHLDQLSWFCGAHGYNQHTETDLITLSVAIAFISAICYIPYSQGLKKHFCVPTDELLRAKDDLLSEGGQSLSSLTEQVCICTDKIFWDKLWNFRCLKRLQHENLCHISYLNDISLLLNKDNDSFCTVSRSTCKLGGSRRPLSPTVNCLSEESDIASYFVYISLMFASLI